jgi:uncharacterized protein (UPF0335 family)
MTQIDKKQLENFIEKYKAFETEIKLIQEDKKHLVNDLKVNHGITTSVIKKAIQVAKIRTNIGDELTQFDELVDLLEGVIK